MSHTPVVSVLMTAFNRENLIAEAIESVLSSTFSDLELIIVDDQSTDGTLQIAQAFERADQRVKVFRNEVNLGDYPNRNKAASYANGKYLKYLDSDDIMYTHCLQVMVAGMESFPEAGFGLSCVSDPAHPFPHCINPREAYLEHFLQWGHFDRAPGSSIIRTDAFRKVGGFSGKRMIGDNEMWMILGRYYPLVKLPRDLYWARHHVGQESKSGYAKKYQALRDEVFRDALQHRDCPLNAEEKKTIIRTNRRRKIKHMVQRVLP